MCRLLKVSFIIVVFLFSILWANEPAARILSYELEVGFFPDARMDFAGLIEVLEGTRPEWNKEDSFGNYPHMKGKALMVVDLGQNPCSSLDFYMHGELRAHWLKLGTEELKFSQERVFYPVSYSRVANKVSVKLNGLSGKHRFEMAYGGVFNPSVASAASSYMRTDKQGAYLRAFGYSMWFPVVQKGRSDVPRTNFTTVKIITPKHFVPVFTGNRLTETVKGQHRLSQWQAIGINLWDAQMTVRPFKIKQNKGLFIYHLDNAKSAASSADLIKYVKQLLAYFSDHYRAVKNTPQLHVAELPNFASGISSGNMIGMTSGQWQRFSLMDKDVDMEILVSHELVHTFVRPEVSINSPLYALIIEGFPSYFHFPALAEILGEEWYQKYIGRVEKSYLRKKKTGKNWRGRPLPVEKPILTLTAEDISEYKDTFILNDRVRLFLHYIRTKLGKKRFKSFTRQLCGSRNLTPFTLIELIEKYLPASAKDVRLWLGSNEYPQRFHLKKK